MLYSDRIDIFEWIDINEISKSKNSNICHIWYFLHKGFKFQPNVCNRSHDFIMISMNLSDIAIVNIKNFDYRCITSLVIRNEAINLIRNADSTEKSRT